jgi:membrane protein
VTALRQTASPRHTAPARASRRGLWPVVKQIYSEFSDDRIPTVAGGITFFALLALFPGIAATVSVFGVFAHRTDVSRNVDLVSGFLPGGAVTILRAELHRLAAQKTATLNIAFVVSFVVALWSASGGYKALVEGLNVAFEVRETRSFVRQTLNALIFTVAGIVFAAAIVGLGVAISQTDKASPAAQTALRVLSWPILYFGCALVLAVIYRFGPDRPHLRWRWITWGSATASALWVIGTQTFTWYVEHFGSYNRVYGDLGAAVGFLTWLWLSLVILLLGAEINCELERVSDGETSTRGH